MTRWVYDEHNGTMRVWASTKTGIRYGIADVCINRNINDDGPSKQERDAARLIAASLDLLEALKAVTELAEWYYTQAQKNTPLLQKPGQINIARAAIAKAEGEG